MDETAFPRATHMSGRRRPKAFLILIGVLVLLGLLVYAGTRFLGTGSENPEEEGEVLPTAVIAPSSTPGPSPDKETPTPTEEAEEEEEDEDVTPTKSAGSTTLDKSSLVIQVLNGSGISGEAGKVQASLEDLGYTDVTTGNADSFDYEDLTISVKSTKANFLKALETDLSDSYTIGDTDTSLASSEYDVVIIVGQ